MTHSGANIRRALPQSFKGVRRAPHRVNMQCRARKESERRAFRDRYPLERVGKAKWSLVEVD